jgi:hypothetical protein
MYRTPSLSLCANGSSGRAGGRTSAVAPECASDSKVSRSSKLGTSGDALDEHGAVSIDGATFVVRLALLPEAVA